MAVLKDPLGPKAFAGKSLKDWGIELLAPGVLDAAHGAPSLGGPLPINITDPFSQFSQDAVNQMIIGAPQTGVDLRNRALGALLAQLGGPSFAGLFASAGADQAAQGLIAGRKGSKSALQKRGLATSGAKTATDRGLTAQYGGNLAGVTANAGQAEEQRQLALLQQLLGLGQADVGFARSLADAASAVHGAANAQDAMNFASRIALGEGSAQIAATLASLGVGAAGGFGGGAGAGAGAGAAGGEGSLASGGVGVGAASGGPLVGGGGYGSLASGGIGYGGAAGGSFAPVFAGSSAYAPTAAGGLFGSIPPWLQNAYGALNVGNFVGGAPEPQQPVSSYYVPGFSGAY